MIVKQEFMARDVVRYIPMGDKEYVLEEGGDIRYPLFIKSISTFTLDGRTSVHHTHPLLILIRRPEEKKKWYQVFYKCHNEECLKMHYVFITAKTTSTLTFVEYLKIVLNGLNLNLCVRGN